ncbi:MAG: hypothetical protein QM765_26780 [Myxococcales bacterium]
MTNFAQTLVAVFVLLLSMASVARADPPQAPAVPDPVFRAVVGRQVELRLLDGRTAAGQLLSLEAENAVLVLPDGKVISLPRAQVLEVRLSSAAMAAAATASPTPSTSAVVVDLPRAAKAPEIPSVDRHFGVQFGLAPGILALDLAYGSFYGFLSGSLALPLYSIGSGNNFGGITLAPGLTFKLADGHNWYFDLFVHGTVAWYGHQDYGYYPYGYTKRTSVDGSAGLGMGFHYTSPSGFTVGFKLPIIGAAFGEDVSDQKSSGGYYYLNALVSFPAATIGYRF